MLKTSNVEGTKVTIIKKSDNNIEGDSNQVNQDRENESMKINGSDMMVE